MKLFNYVMAIVVIVSATLLILKMETIQDSHIAHLRRMVCLMTYATEMKRIGDAFAGAQIDRTRFGEEWLLARVEYNTNCQKRGV